MDRNPAPVRQSRWAGSLRGNTVPRVADFDLRTWTTPHSFLLSGREGLYALVTVIIVLGGLPALGSGISERIVLPLGNVAMIGGYIAYLRDWRRNAGRVSIDAASRTLVWTRPGQTQPTETWTFDDIRSVHTLGMDFDAVVRIDVGTRRLALRVSPRSAQTFVASLSEQSRAPAHLGTAAEPLEPGVGPSATGVFDVAAIGEIPATSLPDQRSPFDARPSLPWVVAAVAFGVLLATQQSSKDWLLVDPFDRFLTGLTPLWFLFGVTVLTEIRPMREHAYISGGEAGVSVLFQRGRLGWVWLIGVMLKASPESWFTTPASYGPGGEGFRNVIVGMAIAFVVLPVGPTIRSLRLTPLAVVLGLGPKGLPKGTRPTVLAGLAFVAIFAAWAAGAFGSSPGSDGVLTRDAFWPFILVWGSPNLRDAAWNGGPGRAKPSSAVGA